MVESPGLEITATPAPRWHAEGPLSQRVLRVAARVAERLTRAGATVPTAHFKVVRAPAEHVGLGVGTQLSLAVARLVIERAGVSTPPPEALAEWTDRGLRSGIGLHGFFSGGFLVDGGRSADHGIPPLLARHTFPPDWSILVVLPAPVQGLHGSEEARAFAQLTSIPERLTNRLCRLVLLGLLPAIVEHDLETFGAALTELQDHVGRWFAPVQGGIYARPELEAIVNDLKAQGLHGVGQSSWGPTLYAFSQHTSDQRAAILRHIRERFEFQEGAAFWTAANSRGAVLETRQVPDL
jgi:beta-RFAP synthase